MPGEFDPILLDLDGTLVRSDAGILNSVAYALEKLGRPCPARADLLGFVGPPLAESFRVICGLPEAEAARAVALYRERYAEGGVFEGALYEGIPELLAALVAAGRRLHLATSKPHVFAVQILAHFGIAGYFARVHGSGLDDRAQAKARIIAEALAGVSKSGAVMVGDRFHDVAGARENGIPCVGVLYGYGSRAELAGAGADWLAEDAAALGRILLGGEAGHG